MEKSSSCGVFSLDAAAGFISFTGNQTRAHREGGHTEREGSLGLIRLILSKGFLKS